MKRSQTELTYLQATVQNASPAGLVIILLDQLVHDLRSTIAAIHDGNIEKRSAELKHAFLVLQQLQGSLDMENGGAAAKHFADFYSVVRSRLMLGHIKASAQVFSEQIDVLLDMRQTWQRVDRPGPTPANSPSDEPASIEQPRNAGEENLRADWTA